MTDASQIRALLKRVEDAEGADYKLGIDVVAEMLRDPETGNLAWSFGDPTASVDSALALVAKVLPGWELERRVTDSGTFVRLVGPEYVRFDFMGENNPHKSASIAGRGRDFYRPDALAILAALLRAKLASADSEPAGPKLYAPM